MVAEKQKPTGMMAWILAILLIPYVAVPFYFIFGIRKRKRRRHKGQFTLRKIDHVDESRPYPIRTVLINQHIPKPTRNNDFSLYTNGISAYEALMTQINNAKDTIYISTYVFQNDDVTANILKALTTKAQQGVTVKLLIDALGSWKVYFFYQRIFKPLKEAGAKVVFLCLLFKCLFVTTLIIVITEKSIYLTMKVF